MACPPCSAGRKALGFALEVIGRVASWETPRVSARPWAPRIKSGRLEVSVVSALAWVPVNHILVQPTPGDQEEQ